MTKEVVELFRRASDLPDSDRATLAGLLIESLESEHETDVESAWLREIERRLQQLDSGVAKTVPWEQVRAKLFRLMGGKSHVLPDLSVRVPGGISQVR
ncbi:MAG: addiction module protein [Acidobacteria bacterium]|nr:addiction module protein [Acidobacteriota bacterium]